MHMEQLIKSVATNVASYKTFNATEMLYLHSNTTHLFHEQR